MSVGSEFHRSDTATGKERRPTVVSRNGGTNYHNRTLSANLSQNVHGTIIGTLKNTNTAAVPTRQLRSCPIRAE